MESKVFRVIVNLKSYYNDHRSLAYVLISDQIQTIDGLKQKISRLFGIKDFYLSCQDKYLPSLEDIKILHDDECVCVVPKKKYDNEENKINNILEKRNKKNSKKRKDGELSKEEHTNYFSGNDETVTSEKPSVCKLKKKKRVSYNEEIDPDMKLSKRKKKQDYSIHEVDEDVKNYSQEMSIKKRQNSKQEPHYNNENTDSRIDLPEERSTIKKGKQNSNRNKEAIIFSSESDIQDTALIESETENNQKVNKNSRKGNVCQDSCDKMETVNYPTNFKSEIYSKQIKSFLDKAYQKHDQTDETVSNQILCSNDGHDTDKKIDTNEKVHIKSLVVIPAECTETITDTNSVIRTKRKRIRKRKRKNINSNCDIETSILFNSTPKDHPLIHIKFDDQGDEESVSAQPTEKDTSIITNSKLNTSSLRNINIVPIIRSVNSSCKENNIISKNMESKSGFAASLTTVLNDTENNCEAEILNSNCPRDLKNLKFSENGIEAEKCLKNVLPETAHESVNIQLLVNGNNSDPLCKQNEHIPVKTVTPEFHKELGVIDTVYENLDVRSDLNSKSANNSFIKEAITPDKIALSMNQPILDSPPEIGKIIVFKILKMSDNYTPEVSSSIVGKILSFCQETNQLSMKIIYGWEQCAIPKGKFHLESEEPEADSSVRTFEWADLIEPRLHT